MRGADIVAAKLRIRSASRRVESRRRWVDETRQAEPAATSADRGGGWRKPAGRPEDVRARNQSAETRRAAGPVQRAIAIREGGPLAARVEDAGNRIQLHAAPRLRWQRDAVSAPLRAASLGHTHDRSCETPPRHSRHGGSPAI